MAEPTETEWSQSARVSTLEYRWSSDN